MAASEQHMKRPPRSVTVMGAVLMLGCAAGTVSMLRGCQQESTSANVNVNVEPVTIAGQKFMLDLAIDEDSRVRGLGGRESIAPQGGMIFAFPFARVLGFVMRDCPVAIDLAFVDDAGRVLVIHEMTPEEPQREGEDAAAYEQRLKVYSSRFPCRFAVEVAGGTLAKLGVKPGDQIEFDAEGLKRRVR